MCADYHYNVTKTQTDIAKKIFFPLGVLDLPAALNNAAVAMKLYTNSTKSTSYTTLACSFNKIAEKLDSSNNPVIIAVTYTNKSEDHDLACYGYDTSDSQLAYYDPKGWQYEEVYADLFDGVWQTQEGIC